MVVSRLLPFVLALVLAGAPANAAPSTGVQSALAFGQAGSACGVVDQNQYWLCKALEEGNCGLTSVSEEYWFCKGIVDRQCGLIEGANYDLCQAVTTRNCDLVTGNRYGLCRGITEQNCALAPRPLYWMCTALQNRFRA